MNLGLPIDWAATGSMLSGWATFAGVLAVIYAARVGSNTFDAWKRQKLEERRMDAAERILTLAYRLRFNFRSIRAPFIDGREMEQAEARLRESMGDEWTELRANQKQRYMTAQAILTRANRYQDDWQQIWELKPIALAFFDAPVEEALDALWKQYVELTVAAETYVEVDETTDDVSFLKATRHTLFRQSDDTPIVAAINAAVEALETELRPIVYAAGTHDSRGNVSSPKGGTGRQSESS